MMEEIHFQRASDVSGETPLGGKGVCPQLCDLSSVPEIHEVEGKNGELTLTGCSLAFLTQAGVLHTPPPPLCVNN